MTVQGVNCKSYPGFRNDLVRNPKTCFRQQCGKAYYSFHKKDFEMLNLFCSKYQQNYVKKFNIIFHKSKKKAKPNVYINFQFKKYLEIIVFIDICAIKLSKKVNFRYKLVF